MNEKEFGARLKPWLERSADQVGELQAARLRAARMRAVDAYREPVTLLGLVSVNAGVLETARYTILQRALMVVPVAALLAVLAVQSLTTEVDLGELDAQLLSQELPPDAFLDKEFRAWLGKSSG